MTRTLIINSKGKVESKMTPSESNLIEARFNQALKEEQARKRFLRLDSIVSVEWSKIIVTK